MMTSPVPEVIYGPPGTGKTNALLEIIEGEIERGTKPDKIACLTFTRRAAEEAATRAGERFGLSSGELPYFRTIHSLCYRQLGLRPSDVLEGSRMREFVDWAGIQFTGHIAEDEILWGSTQGDRIMFMENLARVRCMPLRELYDLDDDDLPWSEVDRVSRAINEYKKETGVLDYTDMLTQFLSRGVVPNIEVVLQDESQDSSPLQWKVIDKLAAVSRRFIVGGDDDQLIFQWAGADPDRLITMDGKITVLGQSYRVPTTIQTLAISLSDRLAHRRPKEWSPREATGILDDEAEFANVDLSGHDILVLARNNRFIREIIIPELRRRGILYEWHGKISIEPAVLAAILIWEDLRQGKTVTLDDLKKTLEWVTNTPPLKKDLADQISRHDLPELDLDPPWFKALDRLPPDEVAYILAARRAGERVTGKPRVRLSTIHGAKGGQAEHVVLLRDMARRTYREAERNPDPEVRVWYVGVTRARERLTLVGAQSRFECAWV